MENTTKVTEKATSDNKLISFWIEQNDKADTIKLEEAALEIQIQAESDIHAMYKGVSSAKASLRKAKVNAQNRPNFKDIADLSLEVKTTTKILNEALEVYKELFGENPKFDFTKV